MTQQITLIRGSSNFEGLAVLELDLAAITLVGLGPLGNRMMTVSWDGSVLTKEYDASIPRQLPAEEIIHSVQLAYWPDDALRKAPLQAGWELKLESGRRVLLHNGKEILVVRYRGDRFVGSPIEIEDKEAGYTTVIKTLELDLGIQP